MKKILLSLALVLLSGVTMAQNTIDFTFTRNGTGATVAVNGAVGVTATIAATSASNAWNTDGAMASRTEVLCPKTNTNATSEASPITYTLTVEGLQTTVSSIKFTHIAVNSGGNLQPANDIDIRHCNFKLEANDSKVGSISDQNIWIAAGNADRTIAFDNLNVEANGTLTIKLTLYKGTTNAGCFYGLTKISLDVAEAEVEEQEVAFLTQVTASDLMAKTEATNIAIKNLSYTNNRWFVGNTGAVPYSAEELTENAIFVWEPVTEGQAGSYRLKKLDGTYMQTSSPKDFGTIDNAAVFTATNPTSAGSGSTNFNGDGDSNIYITGSNDANLVRFVKGNNWINVQNGAGGTPTYNTGTGGWTIHYVYEVTEVASFKANISSAGYATFFAPAEVTIPESVKAYYIAADGINSNYVTLTQIENIIPANTAVILEGAEGEYTFNVSETGAAAITGNLLKGTVINTNIIGDAYVLGVVEGETGLYKTKMSTVALSQASGSVSVFLNNANKAYLPASAVPAAANDVASLSFRFGGGTTGVDEVKGESVEVKAIYDLTGRRVEAITAPGIYIVNGKKVLVK